MFVSSPLHGGFHLHPEKEGGNERKAGKKNGEKKEKRHCKCPNFHWKSPIGTRFYIRS
ncbi:hypothetical protein CE91St56_18580 [Lachnospiraceae bacterium]|nr:hypothetical protein CE91St56_18580 [Lachnospiraceae bacterium]GKH40802.1 hypothetical protein CE91St57_17760 [Lachnospiraceae bacterium]